MKSVRCSKIMRNFIVPCVAVICLCISASTTSAAASTDANDKTLQARSLIDRLVDLALKKVREVQQPVKLEDVVKQFKKKILLLQIDAEIILYNGNLTGIDTIKRCSDAEYHFHHMKVDVNSSFQFDMLNFSYDFQASLFKVQSNGVMKGNISQLVTDVGLLIDLTKRTIELTRLKLVKAKTLKIQVDSREYSDKFINYFLRLITSNFKSILLSQMEKELQSLLGKTIPINFNTDMEAVGMHLTIAPELSDKGKKFLPRFPDTR